MANNKAVVKSAKTQNKASRYLRGVWSELKKVHWPNRKTLITYTGVVVASVFVVSLVIWIVDSIFSAILTKII